jgi:beta-galactosidase
LNTSSASNQTARQTAADVWDKGYAWVNGRNLGRFWQSQGPQLTLYVPGAWLKAEGGENEVVELELSSAPDQPVQVGTVPGPRGRF